MPALLENRRYRVTLTIDTACVQGDVYALSGIAATHALCHERDIPESAVDECAAELVRDGQLALVPTEPLPLFGAARTT